MVKRNWIGSTTVVSVIGMKPLSIYSLSARWQEFLWRSVQISFNITPPSSVGSLFGTWLDGIESDTARHIRVGVCALLWAIWNCRNDLAFNRITTIHISQVVITSRKGDKVPGRVSPLVLDQSRTGTHGGIVPGS